jgi:hypothetical protein
MHVDRLDAGDAAEAESDIAAQGVLVRERGDDD